MGPVVDDRVLLVADRHLGAPAVDPGDPTFLLHSGDGRRWVRSAEAGLLEAPEDGDDVDEVEGRRGEAVDDQQWLEALALEGGEVQTAKHC